MEKNAVLLFRQAVVINKKVLTLLETRRGNRQTPDILMGKYVLRNPTNGKMHGL